jgi:hypothetical protein
VKILVFHRPIPAVGRKPPNIAIRLEALGHTVTLANDGPVDLETFDVALLMGNPGYYPGLRRQLRSTPKAGRPLIAALHSEPLPPPRASGLPRWTSLSPTEIGKIVLRDWRATDIYSNALTLRRVMREGMIDLLFVTSAEKAEYMREQGYTCWFIPFGYEPSDGRLLGLERDIDVLFLGDTRPPRRRRLLRHLQQRGIDVTVRGSWHDAGAWGENRTQLLNRTKIIVHLQRYPGKLARQRFILAMANGVLMISEPVYKPEPFVDGVHFVMAPVERMPALIRHYLEHPAEREQIVAAGHRLVTEQLTMERSVRAMLDIMAGALASRSEAS